MWITKGCPRCKGNLFIEESIGSRFEKGLQCGYQKEILKPVNKSISQPVQEKVSSVRQRHRRTDHLLFEETASNGDSQLE